MCITIAVSGAYPARNTGQQLAGTGVFFSRPRGRLEATLDEPLQVSLLRLHLKSRHRHVGEGEERAPLAPDGCAFITRYVVQTDEVSRWLSPSDDPDGEAFRQAILSDSPVGRGFWRSVKTADAYIPAEVVPLCTRGRWAAIVPGLPMIEPRIVEDGYAVFGGWKKDGYGCYLSYLIPASGRDLELDGQFEAGPSGLIYQVGHLGIKVPRADAPTWGFWLRCSDTGASSGFLVGAVHWWGPSAHFEPVLASTFAAPHAFPATGYFFSPKPCVMPDYPNSLAGACAAAERIAEHGFAVPDPVLPSGHIYDALAAEHAAGLGAWGL